MKTMNSLDLGACQFSLLTWYILMHVYSSPLRVNAELHGIIEISEDESDSNM